MTAWIHRGLKILLKEGPRQLLRKLWWRLSGRHRLAIADARQRAQIPTMLKSEEQSYLYTYAADEYRGRGAIVDLGCWLGGSTAPLAQGLERNKRAATRQRVVDSYDQFLWTPWMAERYRDTPLGYLHIDESFLSEYEKNIFPWADRLRVHAGDLNEIGWTGGPIEYLFVDAMKSWDLANSVVRHFYPALQAGISTVVHQDFVHWNTPWILLLSYRFREWLEPYRWVANSASFVFRCVAEPVSDVLQERYGFDSFSADEAEDAFAFCRELVPREAQANIVAAHLAYHIYLGNLEHARDQLDAAIAEGWSMQSELRYVGPRLRTVEALRHLLQAGAPLTAAGVAGRGFLDDDDAARALAELEQQRFARCSDPSNGSYEPTDSGRQWIERSFRKAAFLDPRDRQASP